MKDIVERACKARSPTVNATGGSLAGAMQKRRVERLLRARSLNFEVCSFLHSAGGEGFA
jgi:hypothetical protein